jgi:YbbR domain-containing protein
MSLLKGSFFLKLLSLILALVTYFYINNERTQTQKSVTDPSYKLIKLTAKSLQLKVRLATSPPDGYKLLSEQVKVEPSQIVVIGPEALLDEAFTAETSLLDLSENTRTIKKRIPIESVAGIHLTGEPYVVEVTVPIEKVEPAA